MDCLHLEIEGQSCLVGSVDQGLMKNRRIDLLDRMTQKGAGKNYFNPFSPMATLPGILQLITPKNCLETFWPNYRLSIVIGRPVTTECQKFDILEDPSQTLPGWSTMGPIL